MGAAFLAACGGSDSGSGGSSGGGDKGGSSAVNKPEDTLKEAKRGGTIKDRTFGDVSTQDPFTPNNTLNAIEGQVYSSLVKFKPGYLKLPSEQELIGDLAESWETSPDGLHDHDEDSSERQVAQQGAGEWPHLRCRRRAGRLEPLRDQVQQSRAASPTRPTRVRRCCR